MKHPLGLLAISVLLLSGPVLHSRQAPAPATAGTAQNTAAAPLPFLVICRGRPHGAPAFARVATKA